MKYKIIITLLITMMMTSVIVIPMVSADQLDQENGEESNDTIVIGPHQNVAQSFVPSMAKLTKIEVYLYRWGSPSGPITCRIRSSLTGSDLATVTKSVEECVPTPYTSSWVLFDFTDINVNPGSTYFIYLDGNELTQGASNHIDWHYTQGNLYTNGCQWVKYPDTNWESTVDDDQNFKTYGETGDDSNNPPNIPYQPNGPNTGQTGVSYEFYTSTTDPDNDQIYYQFDWDADGSHDYSDWLGPYDSGFIITEYHTFTEGGSYAVKVKAKDPQGAQSSWSTAKTVTIYDGEKPTVQTIDAFLNEDYAVLNANIQNLGDDTSCQAWFVYDNTHRDSYMDYKYATNKETITIPTSFHKVVTWDTTDKYYFRVVASNKNGATQGSEKEFLPPNIGLSKETIDFGQNLVNDNIKSANFEIWNSGDGILEYNFIYDCQWIESITPSEGTISGYDYHYSITVKIDTTGLEIGDYSYDVKIQTNNMGIDKKINVKVEVVNYYTPATQTMNKPNAVFCEDYIRWIDDVILNTIPNVGLDYYWDEWKNRDEWFKDCGYGYKTDLNEGFCGIGIKNKLTRFGYNVADNPDDPREDLVYMGYWEDMYQSMGYTFTVPVINKNDVIHNAKISMDNLHIYGNLKSDIYSVTTVSIMIEIVEGDGQTRFLVENDREEIEYKWLKNIKVGDTGIPLFGVEELKTFNDILDHEKTGLEVQLQEGRTYTCYIVLGIQIAAGFRIGVGIGCQEPDILWAGVNAELGELKIEYHNPPPSPKTTERPNIEKINGNNMPLIDTESYYSIVNNEHDNDCYYLWDWGEGTNSGWVKELTKSHTYTKSGRYTLNVHLREKKTIDGVEYIIDSPYKRMNIFAIAPAGDFSISIPEQNSYKKGEKIKIQWIQKDNMGENMYLGLYHANDDYLSYIITKEPVPVTSSFYEWRIPTNIEPDSNYHIIAWTAGNYSCSKTFSITGSKSNEKNLQYSLLQRLIERFPIIQKILNSPMVSKYLKR